MITCAQCRYSRMDKDPNGALKLYCFYNPPNAVAFAMPAPGAVGIATVTCRPEVHESQFCSKAAPRASIAV